MKQKMMSLLLALVVVVTMFGARPVFAQGETPIDLSMDRNGNQISDAVEAEVATLKTLSADQQTAEMKNFFSKLPLSPETLALQEQALQLSNRFSSDKPEEAQAILDELAKVTSQLQEDPVIQKVETDLLQLTGFGIVGDGSTPSLSKVDFRYLNRGDILARKSWWGFVFPWAMLYEHTGNFDGNSKVYESNPDGVKLRSLDEWKSWGQYVGHARNNRVSPATMASAMDWAKNKWGTNGRTAYNYFFWDKIFDGSLYCSQLTWKINKHVGYNLDSNHAGYQLAMVILFGPGVLLITIPAVAPDEVMLSPFVTVIDKGWN